MDSLWVIVTIALVGLAPAIGSVWWLVRSRHAEQRHLEAMNRMLATYPPGPPPVRVKEPPLIVVRPRRPPPPPAPPPRRPIGLPATRVVPAHHLPAPRQHVPALSMVPVRSHGRHARTPGLESRGA